MNRDDEWIRQMLAREPRPELSPFFAARVTNELQRREKSRRRPIPLALRLYWLALLGIVVFAIHATAIHFDVTILSLVLVPAGFGVWVYREELGRIFIELAAVMFSDR